jgi:hypothetical protein
VFSLRTQSCSGRGRPKKKLSEECCRKTENNVIDGILFQIEGIAKDHDISPNALFIKIRRRAKQKWNSNLEDNKRSVTPQDACVLLYNVDISLSQYQKLRLYLKDYDFRLPSRHKLNLFKKSLLVPFVAEPAKSYCSLKDMIVETVGSLLQIYCPTINFVNSDLINVTGKIGIDGSGCHNIRHQLDETNSNVQYGVQSYIGTFWCPLKIEMNSRTIWENKQPNSVQFSRPLCLVIAKENRENVYKHFKPYLDEAYSMEQLQTIQLGHQTIKMAAVSELSMIDGKMANIIQGDSGSFCHYCNVTRNNANDLTEILQGFNIEKTLEDMKSTWDMIQKGDMSYSSPNRYGQCHQPLNNHELKFFGILHQKLRSLDFCLKLLYHLVSGQTQTWSEASNEVKSALKKAKFDVMQHIRKNCGFLVDSPTSAGGNTNSGPIAERFFSIRHRVEIGKVIVDPIYQHAYLKLIGLINQMLSITQHTDSSKLVKPHMVKLLGYETMVHIKKCFPFAMISPSLHQMCAHSWELFEITEGNPIAIYSEQPGEAWNKYIRSYKSGPASRARQSSIKANTQDIFTRMVMKSHPMIASKKKDVQCKVCGKVGHTVKSCPTNNQDVLDEETAFIQTCYY